MIKYNMELKDGWFALKSHVYVEFKENNILLYDTKLGFHIETENKDVVFMINQLYEPILAAFMAAKNRGGDAGWVCLFRHDSQQYCRRGR